MYSQIDTSRRQATAELDQSKRSDLGQFFTPYDIARFMASLFRVNGERRISLLDPGAGIGSLSVAFLEQLNGKNLTNLDIIAYEYDGAVSNVLKDNLNDYSLKTSSYTVTPKVIVGDFIQEGIISYLTGRYTPIDYAILNPPYKKINSDSKHRLLLRKAGIETGNLYSAFVALSILLMKKGGELVAIIPRSFCNGPYFKPFREFLLERTSIKQIHIFNARDKAFKEDNVLQENIIIHLKKGEIQGDVKITSSTGDNLEEIKEFIVPFQRVVSPNDSERFIHIPAAEADLFQTIFNCFSYSLRDLGIEVSTGPVVDFRIKDFLRKNPDTTTAPLLYPAHFGDKYINWPKPDFKKSNAVVITSETQKFLYPSGYYTIIRRFSSKEEKRRIVARVLAPQNINAEFVGFENHLNVFHQSKIGLTEEIALGIAVYLNSKLIDDYFRQFNGHTQVNATDLRLIKYPSRQMLIELGQWAKTIPAFNQEAIDAKISSIL
jgi:adenine-specific DNA-methyltransferase